MEQKTAKGAGGAKHSLYKLPGANYFASEQFSNCQTGRTIACFIATQKRYQQSIIRGNPI